MKKGNMLRGILIVFFLGLIGFSGWRLYLICAEYAKGVEAYDALAVEFVSVDDRPAGSDVVRNGREKQETDVAESEADEMISVDFAALEEVCEDVVGWLYCPGTKVNYPVVQNADNDYYLHRLINGEYSLGGTLFLDYRNADDFSDWNSIVYGHNMKDGSMLAVLPDYMEQEFYEEHPVWYLLTEEVTYQIELVGGYVTPADSDTYSFPESAEEKDVLSRKAVRLSSFQSENEILEDDKLITLSTCVYDYDNARYVLVGVLRPLETAED